ncbi:BURP domain protein RD22-like [Salvia divinorum]|uniref:BURP domain protein RD22-like n=1 Tax=Salvia divinorum TaxID=28513 RepID=A0ABD1HAW2_SALDI
MESKILPFFAFLYVAIVVSHAALPSEEYWNSVLPNTPMPKALKNLLQPTPDWLENKTTSVGVGHGGVSVNSNNASISVGSGGVNVNTTRNNGTHVSVGGPGGGITVATHNRNGKPIYVRVSPSSHPFIYKYAATATQLRDDPTVALFFLEKDLRAGNKMTLRFTGPTNRQKFLPRRAAASIPFSSAELPEIYRELSVRPGSAEAEAIEKTVQECEDAANEREETLCATSLEAMVDFGASVVGRDAPPRALSTEADSAERMEYLIEAVRRLPSDKPIAACHKEEYAYAVFYCHKTDATVAYGVSLVGSGGARARARAVAVCHRDTSGWNPEHLAFRVLGVKPGSVPVCHYLPEDHIVWVSKN